MLTRTATLEQHPSHGEPTATPEQDEPMPFVDAERNDQEVDGDETLSAGEDGTQLPVSVAASSTTTTQLPTMHPMFSPTTRPNVPALCVRRMLGMPTPTFSVPTCRWRSFGKRDNNWRSYLFSSLISSLRSQFETAIDTGELTDVARGMLTVSKPVHRDWHDKLPHDPGTLRFCAILFVGFQDCTDM